MCRCDGMVDVVDSNTAGDSCTGLSPVTGTKKENIREDVSFFAR